MAALDFSQPLLGAGASAKTNFAAAQARTGLNFIGEARFKRGIKAEIGVEAFANASAGLSKFIHASIEGTAFARAQAGIQLQLPLNLFDEFGFSARAEAIAEAAAGVEVALGLSIGDFILLAKRDPNLIGLPLEMLLLFLEEVSIGGAFEVNVSASAKAHASVSVAGTIIEKAGDKAGFYYTIDAGVGLAAGVGMGLKAGAEFKDFRRFYGRAVDKAVDHTIQEILKLIPSSLKLSTSQDDLRPWVGAFAPIAKMALRMAYDVGLKIAENNPGHSPSHASVLCDETIKTFLEESQRFIIHKLIESGLSTIQKLLEQEVPRLPAGTWDAALPQRTELARHLLAMPDEPFQDLAENLSYWQTLIEKALNLLVAIGDPEPELIEAISIIYCGSELLMEAVRAKVNTASAYAMAVGAGTVNTDTQPFKGQLANQPHPKIAASIKQAIGRNPATLTYADLLQFLVDDAVINNALSAFPEVKKFLNIFRNDFARAENEILKLFLQNASSFDLSNPNAAQVDPRALLTLIVQSIDRFLTEKFKADILPQILSHVHDPGLRLVVEEVLFEAVVYVKEVGLNTILNWDKETFDNDDFTEALAGAIMLLLGRTVVIVADTFITATQEQIRKSCDEVSARIRQAADQPGGNHGEIQHLLQHIDPGLIKLTADCVQIGGMVLGPLTDDTRKRVRNLLYQVFEPVPPGREQDFFANLGDDFFIPNITQLQQVTNELASISKDRFVLFAEQFILRVGDYILDQLEDLILAIIDLVVNWEKHLAEQLLAIARALKQLEDTIRELNRQLTALMGKAMDALHDLFQTLGSATLKNKIKNDLKEEFVKKALNVLEENGLYKALPADWRREIRELTDGAVDAVIDSPLITPVFDAMAKLANQLDELLPDVREIDPDENLPEQFMLLILDRIEENIRDHFGGNKPHISPTIHFRYHEWVVDSIIPYNGHWERKHITLPLGRIEINLSPFINIIKNAIGELNFYHNALNNACFRLGNAFAKELELAAQQLQYENTKKDRQRLDQINREHHDDPKEITVLSPLSLAHFTRTVDIKIHLGGIPMSYLGLGKDEIQRVFIYLNGELIPPKSLLAEESALGSKNGGTHFKDVDFKNLVSVDPKTGKMVNAFDAATGIISRSKASIMTNTALHYPAQHSNQQAVSSGSPFVFSHSKLKAQAVSKSMVTFNQPGPGLVHIEKNSRIAETGKGKGKTVHDHKVSRSFSGQNISASQINRLLEERLPGLLLQFKVELDEPFMVEGVNVLTVVVIERGGNRHQQHVSFTVSHPNISHRPAPGMVRVPDPKTGKTQTATMTLNNIIDSFNKKPTHLSLENYLAAVEKTKIPKTKPQKIPSAVPSTDGHIKKKETVLLVDGNGKQVGAPFEMVYGSAQERKKLLKDRGLDNTHLARKDQRLKTITVSYERQLSVSGKGQNEIITITETSTTVHKEELNVLDDKGKTIKTIQLEYGTPEERKKQLETLKLDNKKTRTKALVQAEKLTITGKNGKVVDTYYHDHTPPKLEPDEIRNYRPNTSRENKLTEVIKKPLGIDTRDTLLIHSPGRKEKTPDQLKTNSFSGVLSTNLSERMGIAYEYLKKQNEMNFNTKNS